MANPTALMFRTQWLARTTRRRPGDKALACARRRTGADVVICGPDMDANRRQAYQVLQLLVDCGAMFDPYAPESQRRQQIARLRDKYERKAG